jgi:NAD(P)-dependent dehydrogenase (short-subunit alcohol dehydrogenase family)
VVGASRRGAARFQVASCAFTKKEKPRGAGPPSGAFIIETACEAASIILVNNAAHQASFKSIEDISDEEWELTFRVNIHAMFYLIKAAVPHMKPGTPSSTPPRSMPMRRTPRCLPTRRPKGRSRISRPG